MCFKACNVTVRIQSITSVAYKNSVLNLVRFGVKRSVGSSVHRQEDCVLQHSLFSLSVWNATDFKVASTNKHATL